MDVRFYRILFFVRKHSKLVLFSACLVLLITAAFILFKQLKPTIETAKSEMKKIPKEVKREIEKQASVSASFRVPILMYHYVEYVTDKKDKIRQSLDITPNVFENQIKTLVDAGYTFMTAKDLGDVLNGKTDIPQKPVILTFDDGHWDLDTVVLPILKKYNVHATAYIVSGFVGTNTDSLTLQEMQDVVNSGLIDVGAHTVHHVSLKGKLLPVVDYEVFKSKQMLEDTYHIKVVSFAYPNGSFDLQAINTVRQAGFTTAVSTIGGMEQNNQNRFFLFRIRPGYRTGQSLLNYLQNAYR